jgi:hypothetical protein
VPIIEAKANMKSRVMVVFTDVKNDVTLETVEKRSGETGLVIWESVIYCTLKGLLQRILGYGSICLSAIRYRLDGQVSRDINCKKSRLYAARWQSIIFLSSIQPWES